MSPVRPLRGCAQLLVAGASLLRGVLRPARLPWARPVQADAGSLECLSCEFWALLGNAAFSVFRP